MRTEQMLENIEILKDLKRQLGYVHAMFGNHDEMVEIRKKTVKLITLMELEIARPYRNLRDNKTK